VSGTGPAVPQREGEHAAEMRQAALAPFLIGVNEHFGVGMGAEAVAATFERGAQMREIVDFAVEDDAHRAVFVEHRLVAAGEINNAQPAHAQHGAGFGQHTPVVRATMDHFREHGTDARFGHFAACLAN